MNRQDAVQIKLAKIGNKMIDSVVVIGKLPSIIFYRAFDRLEPDRGPLGKIDAGRTANIHAGDFGNLLVELPLIGFGFGVGNRFF